MHHYRAYELVIASDIELPALLPVAPQASDVRVRLGNTPRELENPVSRGGLYQASPQQFLFRMPTVADYWVRDGQEIIVQPQPGVPLEDVAVFLLSSCLAALLHQRGVLILHAGAVDTPRGAVLFLGGCGLGKSTTVAGLVQRGYKMLADDVCAVVPAGDTFLALPAYPRQKLTPEAARAHGLDPASLEKVRSDALKVVLPRSEHFCATPRPLAQIYLLRINRGERRVEPIAPPERVQELLRNTYRPRFLKGLGRTQEHFGQIARLAAARSLQQVFRPQSLVGLPAFMDWLAAELR